MFSFIGSEFVVICTKVVLLQMFFKSFLVTILYVSLLSLFFIFKTLVHLELKEWGKNIALCLYKWLGSYSKTIYCPAYLNEQNDTLVTYVIPISLFLGPLSFSTNILHLYQCHTTLITNVL